MKLLSVGERPLPDSDKIKASHISFAIDVHNLRFSIDGAVEVLKHYEFDAIAFRGMSGALIGPSIAMRLNKSMILIRKDNDNSHSNMSAEGDPTARTYIIVDDFQSSGSTAKEVFKGVRAFAPNAVFLGFLPVHRICYRVKSGEPLEIRLENVECYNFPEGKAPQLTKIKGKWRLPLEAYLKALHDQHPERREQRTDEDYPCVQRIPAPKPQTYVVDEALQQIMATFDYKDIEARTVRWLGERYNNPPAMFGGPIVAPEPTPTPEAKNVPKEVVPVERSMVKRNAMSRNIFGMPYGGRVRVSINYKVQGR